MNKNKRKIPADAIKNEQSLDGILQDLMKFPGWHGERNADWIDMVTMGGSRTNGIPHFHTTEEDFFVIEITGGHALLERPPLISQLVKRVSEINQRSQERVGRSLLLLLFS